jgi:hypothetical protein
MTAVQGKYSGVAVAMFGTRVERIPTEKSEAA